MSSFLHHRRRAFSFTPTDIPGLTLWLDANEGVYNDAGSTLATDGQTVQEWHDQSGNDNHVTQTTEGNKPEYRSSGLNSSPSVDFVRANDDQLIIDPLSITGPFTYFFVAQIDIERLFANIYLVSTGSTQTERADFMVQSTLGIDHRLNGFQGYSGGWDDATSAGEAVLISDGAQILTAQLRDTSQTSDVYINGSNVTNARSGSTDPSPTIKGISIGSSWSPANCWDGDISEVLIYDGTLTASEQSAVESYLADKWGITI